MNEWVNDTWEKLDRKLRAVGARNGDKLPYTARGGRFNDMTKIDIAWWTNGFWPALMWLMYEGTKDEIYRKTAEDTEELLDAAFAKYDSLHHDVGFMFHLSFGADYKITKSKSARTRDLYAANLLAGRYNPNGEFLRSWNGRDNVGWVIIDCMMNIPLLYWASEETGDPRYKYIAMKHADKVLTTHIRPDGSVNHIVELDPATGDFIRSYGGQGYCEGSSWTRGQAWAIYGYALSYIHTGEVRYLDAAKRVAHYFISCVAATDYIPRIDFRAPDEPVLIDTTAGAIAACGLLEISNSVGEYERRTYLDAALRILHSLEENYCDWDTETDAVLGMGSEAYNPGSDRGHHMPIIYGDYFFAEAIYKLRGEKLLFW